MHDLVKRIIELDAIDTPIESIKVDEWFQRVVITFMSDSKADRVQCVFEHCFEIDLKHDRNYSKNIRSNGSKDYEYFMQNFEIIEENGFYIFNIDAWPLNGQIVCKDIKIIV